MPMWRVRAQSSPFCILGTSEAATAQRTVMPAPANRCGPGNSLPTRMYVSTPPSIEKVTPLARRTDARAQCLSR